MYEYLGPVGLSACKNETLSWRSCSLENLYALRISWTMGPLTLTLTFEEVSVVAVLSACAASFSVETRDISISSRFVTMILSFPAPTWVWRSSSVGLGEGHKVCLESDIAQKKSRREIRLKKKMDNDPSLKAHDTNRLSCDLCHGYITDKYGGHNGAPLVDGKVCDECNMLVILARMNVIRPSRGATSATPSSSATSSSATTEEKRAQN